MKCLTIVTMFFLISQASLCQKKASWLITPSASLVDGKLNLASGVGFDMLATTNYFAVGWSVQLATKKYLEVEDSFFKLAAKLGFGRGDQNKGLYFGLSYGILNLNTPQIRLNREDLIFYQDKTTGYGVWIACYFDKKYFFNLASDTQDDYSIFILSIAYWVVGVNISYFTGPTIDALYVSPALWMRLNL